MGVDTVKLSYPLGSGSSWSYFVRSVRDAEGRLGNAMGDFWSGRYECGSCGAVQYSLWHHPELQGPLVVKGVPGSSIVCLWEGSVPKALGVQGAAPGDCVGILDRYIRGLLRESGLLFMPVGTLRRCDLTHDEPDLDGSLRAAAIGWNPHSRSRYVQARYADDETVWLHNTARGVRVYDKFAECGEEWSRGLSRIEYQIRGEWCEKYGLTTRCDFEAKELEILYPLVDELKERRV